jgi:hypothetical protein
MKTQKQKNIRTKIGFWGSCAASKSNGGKAAVFVYTIKIL